MLREVFLGILGICFGMMTAGGVFTVLLAVGLIPRFAGRTHTGGHVMLYETMVILGTMAGDLFSLFPEILRPGSLFLTSGALPFWQGMGGVLLGVYGVFAGIFVGSLAMAIAEMLNSIPIFARRVGFRHGLGIAVGAMALGKLAGSLYYFIGGYCP